jgi:hypothetical protein
LTTIKQAADVAVLWRIQKFADITIEAEVAPLETEVKFVTSVRGDESSLPRLSYSRSAAEVVDPAADPSLCKLIVGPNQNHLDALAMIGSVQAAPSRSLRSRPNPNQKVNNHSKTP